jgi:hypothetical protein
LGRSKPSGLQVVGDEREIEREIEREREKREKRGCGKEAPPGSWLFFNETPLFRTPTTYTYFLRFSAFGADDRFHDMCSLFPSSAGNLSFASKGKTRGS